MKNEYNLVLPIYFTIEKKTKKNQTVLVGMNYYRNAHYHVKNKIKQFYAELVKEQLIGFEEDKLKEIKVNYKLFYKRGDCDLTNVCSVIDKFVLDGLVEFGLISDDNVKVCKRVTFEVGEQDKENPRIEIKIMEV